MKITLISMLKHIAVLGILALVEPFVMIAHTLWGSEYDAIGLVRVMVLVVGYAGYMLHSMHLNLYPKWNQMQKALITTLDLGALVGMVIGISSSLYKDTRYLWLSITAVGLLALVLGVMMSYKSYDQVYSKQTIGILGAMGILCSLKVESPFYVVIVLLNVMLYTLIRNQQNIDQLLERTKKNVSATAAIRQYNIKLITLGMGIVLAACLLKDYIVSLLLGIGNLIKEGVRQLIIFLNSLQNEEKVLEEVVEQATSHQMLEALEHQEPNKWLELLAWVIGIALLIVALRYTWKIAIKYIKKGLLILRKWLDQFLTQPKKTSVTLDYYDQVETLDNIQRKQTMLEKKRALKAWKNKVKAFEQEHNPELKYKAGYNLIIEWLKLKNLPIHSADTPLEISKKAYQKESSWQFDEETQAYNELQYGDYKVTQQKIEKLKATLYRLKDTVIK